MNIQNDLSAGHVVKVKGYLKDMVPGYLENRKKDIREIKDLMAARDFERIKIMGHRMKGSGGGYGFEEISRFGQGIEKGASEKDSQFIKEVLDKLTNYLEKVKVIFEN